MTLGDSKKKINQSGERDRRKSEKLKAKAKFLKKGVCKSQIFW